jgi:hypothetical protein
MKKPSLGQLEKVDLRTHWKDESRDFTPWLAEEVNIALLGRAIAMELEVDSVEKSVGPFFADILCKDGARGKWVVIENQLEKTDHTHLGQVLTYAAGLEAETVIWVAPAFTDEHRAALDWLNEITPENVNFFGVEIELWQIGDSAPAPKFNVVCQPNGWTKSVQASAQRRELSDGQRMQLEFWTGFRAYMEGKGPIRCSKPQPQIWMNHALGLRGCHLASVISSYDSTTNKVGGELRAEVYLDSGRAKDDFAKLAEQREAVERDLGEPMTWYNPPEARMSRIYVRRPAEISNRSQWPEYFEWFKEKLEAIARVFVPRVRALGEDAASVR